MSTEPPLAFLSYTHQDDVHEGGKLRKFAERLSGEVRLHSGEDFPIFVDRSDLKWGQEWQKRIEESLSGATFLIPILTPGYFKSDWCRKEFLRFLDRERALKRRDLILAVYYVRCPQLEDPSKRSEDKLAQILRDRQYKDCRNLRHLAWAEPEITRLFENMALEVVAALERPDALLPAVAQTGTEFTNRSPARASVARGEASYWDSVEASQLSVDWKKRLRSFVKNAEGIPYCDFSWQKGLLINLPGVVPQKALVGIRRDGTLEVYLARWKPLRESPLTEFQERRKQYFFNKLQSDFGMSSEDLNKQYPQLSLDRWLPKASQLEDLISYLAQPEEPPSDSTIVSEAATR